MQLHEIDVFIETDGRVRLEVHGAQGMLCLDFTRDLEVLLGGQVEERDMRPEAFDQEQSQGDQQWLQG
jgi:hypothetical protein